MRSLLAIVWVVPVAALACSSSSSSGSSVDPSKSLNALSTADLQSLCDWTAQQEGGYGTTRACDAGSPLQASQDQATCVADAMQHFEQPSCTATAGDWMTCVKRLVSTFCFATPPAASGECEAIDTGCYGDAAPEGGTLATEAGSDAAVALPACTWPAAFDAADASNGQCVAARTLLACAGSNGGGEGCISNDPTQCPGPELTIGETYSNCQDQCQPDEYAMMCGFIGPGPTEPDDAAIAASIPPPSCHLTSSNPSGREPYCCPCGQ